MDLRFPCPGCGRTLAASASKAGKRGRCPNCKEPVSAPLNRFRFSCPACGKSLNASSDHGGKRGKCPGCNHVSRIPVNVPQIASEDDKKELLTYLEREERRCPMQRRIPPSITVFFWPSKRSARSPPGTDIA